MRQGTLLGPFFFLSVFSYTASQVNVNRESLCLYLLNCLDTSLLCPVFFAYYNCTIMPPTMISSPNCGESSVTGPASMYPMPRVVGGTDAQDREFPWTVRLRGDNGMRCGGTIIENDVVITAAHCVRALANRPQTVQVGYGSAQITILTFLRVRRIILHPQYDDFNGDNDIAILILSEAFPLSDRTNLRSACLPRQGSPYPRAPECVVAGWGFLEDGAFEIPDTLQKAAVPLVSRDVCQQAYEDTPRILVGDNQLCAGFISEGGVDACQGDSGGPLVCPNGDQWVLYGVVSKGRGCAEAGSPGVYAFVPQHIAWIESQIY